MTLQSGGKASAARMTVRSLALFFDQTATVFDYLGDDALVVLHGDLEPAFQHFWQDTRERHRLLQGDPERPLLACSHLE